MDTNEITITPDMVPPGFVRCFQTDCPQAAQCIRHIVTQRIPEGRRFGPAVYPSARTASGCAMFKEVRIIRTAWGFDALFADVKQRDSAALRKAVKRYLGGNGSYYRYHHGSRLLTPEQQAAILSLFERHGYTAANLRFDGYRDVVDIPTT